MIYLIRNSHMRCNFIKEFEILFIIYIRKIFIQTKNGINLFLTKFFKDFFDDGKLIRCDGNKYNINKFYYSEAINYYKSYAKEGYFFLENFHNLIAKFKFYYEEKKIN